MKKKTFDCVRMKHEIQERVQAEFAGMPLDEASKERTAWLQQSNDPLAVWARRIQTQRDRSGHAD